MDQPRPTVERVPARRSVPVVVGVVAVAFTAILAWQPWADRSAAPSSTALPVAAVSSSPDTSAPSETGTAGVATPSPGPLPSPDVGPLGPAGAFEMTPGPGSAIVECQYSRLRDGRRYFSGMAVHPPTVTAVNDDSGAVDVRSIAWRVEIQANRLEVVFDRGWATVARSRRQVARPATGSSAVLHPMFVEYNVPREEATSVLRALVIVEWYTRNLELAGRVEQVANSYLELSGTRDVIRPEGCHGVREPGAAAGPDGSPRPQAESPVTVELSAQHDPVTCVYGDDAGPDGRFLTSILVQPPDASIDEAKRGADDIRYLGWWAAVDRGEPDAASDTSWLRVAESAIQIVDVPVGADGWQPTSIDVFGTGEPPEVRYRVSLTVQWFSQSTTINGELELTVDEYALGGTRSDPTGCLASRPGL